MISGPVTEADLRRATSSAYYALFHAIAASCADAVLSAPSTAMTNDAWRLAYRALDHGILRNACLNLKVMRALPPPLAKLAVLLPRMQSKRHQADYDPVNSFTEQEVRDDIDSCEAAIFAFLSIPEAERRAFVAFVLFRSR